METKETVYDENLRKYDENLRLKQSIFDTIKEMNEIMERTKQNTHLTINNNIWKK